MSAKRLHFPRDVEMRILGCDELPMCSYDDSNRAASAAQNGNRALQFHGFNNDNVKQRGRNKFDCGLQRVLYGSHQAGGWVCCYFKTAPESRVRPCLCRGINRSSRKMRYVCSTSARESGNNESGRTRSDKKRKRREACCKIRENLLGDVPS